jgi:hypothetical protein
MAVASSSEAKPNVVSPENLALYEVQKPFIEPILRSCRLWNTALDILFYDVGALTAALLMKGRAVNTDALANLNSPRHRFAVLDLGAQSNPSGSIIVVDANLAPYVYKPFLEMETFFEFANGSESVGLNTLTVTGVGSSAFGSVAFAWDVSQAFGEPVAAIVPGYGLADIVPQAPQYFVTAAPPPTMCMQYFAMFQELAVLSATARERSLLRMRYDHFLPIEPNTLQCIPSDA